MNTGETNLGIAYCVPELKLHPDDCELHEISVSIGNLLRGLLETYRALHGAQTNFAVVIWQGEHAHAETNASHAQEYALARMREVFEREREGAEAS